MKFLVFVQLPETARGVLIDVLLSWNRSVGRGA